MVDILPEIAEMLGDIAPVELAFHDGTADTPCIILSEIGNSASVVLSGYDRYSVITLQLDVYAEDEENARGLAVRASAVLARKGIKRSFSHFITDEDKPRMCMRFRFGIDEVSGRTVSV